MPHILMAVRTRLGALATFGNHRLSLLAVSGTRRPEIDLALVGPNIPFRKLPGVRTLPGQGGSA